MKKKVFVSLLAIVVCMTLGGCFFAKNDKTYESHGLSITMPEGYTEKSIVSQTVYLEGTEAIFTALKEDLSSLAQIGIDKNTSLKDYAKAVVENNKADYEIKEEDGLTYFEYEKQVSGKDYYYLTCVFNHYLKNGLKQLNLLNKNDCYFLTAIFLFFLCCFLSSFLYILM